jgi:Rrf2 family iron-sulfur cluster assembly transcriptional regulator
MMLTTKGRYAMMAMVDLEMNAYTDESRETRKAVPLQEIAKRQDIALAYLEQIFSHLKKAGLVKSVRGPGGGYLLARAPEEIGADAIILAAEEKLKTTRCDAAKHKWCMGGSAKCVTHDLWDGLDGQILDYLSGYSIADVVYGRMKVKNINEGHQIAPNSVNS